MILYDKNAKKRYAVAFLNSKKSIISYKFLLKVQPLPSANDKKIRFFIV